MAQSFPLLLTLAEAAAKVRLSTKTLRRAIEDGSLSATKLRGRWFVVESDLAEWLAGGRYVPPARLAEEPKPCAPLEAGSLAVLRKMEAA